MPERKKRGAPYDAATWLSFLIFGFGNAVRGQIGKALCFFAAEVAYIVYMVQFGWFYMKDLPTLGTASQERFFDESLGIYIYIQGDNSLLILLYGVISVFITGWMIVVAVKSVKSAYKAQLLKSAGKRLSTFKEDVKALFDKNLHTTMLVPPALGVIAFTVLPLIFMILIAFTNFDRAHQPPGNLFTWVGFQNFRDIFWENPAKSKSFLGILSWTLVWAVFATFTNFIFGIILAILINKKGIKLKKMWRGIFVSTIAVPQFVSLLLMSRLLHDLGPVNVILQELRLTNEPIQFLTNGNLARITVIIVNMWVGIPYTMLSTTGILMNIPEETYESARIDGANALQEFIDITLPHMIFVMTPALITTFIGNINNFNVIFFLTGGGPLTLDYYQGGKTDLLVTWLYRLTVNQSDFSLASTIGIFVFITSATCSLIVYNRSGSIKREEEFQ